MIVEKFIPVEFAANNYLVYDNNTKEAVLFDCAGSDKELFYRIDELQLNLKYIFITHAHFDHVAGLVNFRAKYPNVKIVLSKKDKMLYDNMKVQTEMFGAPKTETTDIDLFIDEGDDIEIFGKKLNILSTPGHSAGCLCYLIDDNLFSGDTLFYEEIGRCDLPTGSFNEIKDSIQGKLFKLDENVKVFPGHGDNTTIGHEKNENAYFGKNSIYTV